MSHLQQPDPASERLQLVLIEDDPVIRLGLRACLAESGVQVIAEASSAQAVPEMVQSLEPTVLMSPERLLVLLSLEFGQAGAGRAMGLSLCQQLKTRYPALPVLLFGSAQTPIDLEALLQAGASGYCARGVPLEQLLMAIRRVAIGQQYWLPGLQASGAVVSGMPRRDSVWVRWRRSQQQLGLRQIDTAIARITAQSDATTLSWFDQFVLAGRQRELRAARWIVNRLSPPSPVPLSPLLPSPVPLSPLPALPDRPEIEAAEVPPSTSLAQGTVSETSLRSLQRSLWDTIATKLQTRLLNLTSTPLEIDILKQEKKRELLYIILRQVEEVLADLRASQVTVEQLSERADVVLVDIWQATTQDFFGRYYTLPLDDRSVVLADTLLQEVETVRTEILNHIPLLPEFLAHLLFQLPLAIDDDTYPFGSLEATHRMELILQNGLIQLANAVVQPLLNRYGDVAVIKQAFYDKRLLSSREIERFRNQLSWKYRTEKYFSEPTAIFESRFNLWVIQEAGISRASIYAPRNQELAELTGLPYVVTLALETRDAIAPRLRSALSFVGSGVVYVLTEVIGKGLGLIGRGIIKGVGNIQQDIKINRSQRPR